VIRVPIAPFAPPCKLFGTLRDKRVPFFSLPPFAECISQTRKIYPDPYMSLPLFPPKVAKLSLSLSEKLPLFSDSLFFFPSRGFNWKKTSYHSRFLSPPFSPTVSCGRGLFWFSSATSRTRRVTVFFLCSSFLPLYAQGRSPSLASV